MPEPTTPEEFEARHAANLRDTVEMVERDGDGDGDGVVEESVRVMHQPCPFCAAPDFHLIVSGEMRTRTDPLTCSECGRSARYTKVGKSMRYVQTGGPKPPEFANVGGA